MIYETLFRARLAGIKGAKVNFLLIGRDAVAVETVGATLVGLKPKKNATNTRS